MPIVNSGSRIFTLGITKNRKNTYFFLGIGEGRLIKRTKYFHNLYNIMVYINYKLDVKYYKLIGRWVC